MIEREQWEGYEVYRLDNRALSLWIVPTLGANLIRIKDKKNGHEILRAPHKVEDLITKPVYWGTPILFPPNRIDQGRFRFDGYEYRLPVNTPEGHHIHGLVKDKAWRFDTLEDQDDLSQLICSLDFIDYPEIMEGYPHHLKMLLSVSLIERRVTHTCTVTNLGHVQAPIGYGLHTWFSLFGGAKRWKLTVPFESIWELNDSVMPTGRLLPPGRLAPLRTGLRLEDQSFDTALFIGNLSHEVRLSRDDGYTITYTSGEEFLHWVVHTPQNERDVIALEPYTWISNAPNLELAPATTGFLVLEPRQTKSFVTHYEIGI